MRRTVDDGYIYVADVADGQAETRKLLLIR